MIFVLLLGPFEYLSQAYREYRMLQQVKKFFYFHVLKVDNNLEKDPNELLGELNLNNNYFSIRGELVYVNTQKKEVVIKICSSSTSKRLKDPTFKIVIQSL